MHSKVLFHLKKIKEQLRSTCEHCHGSGCQSCSYHYDIYEQMAHAQIPIKYWDFNLNDLRDDISGIDKVEKYIHKLPLAYEEGQGLFIYGKNGNGKTLCACLIGKEALKQGYTVRFAFLGEVISSFIDTMYDPDLREKLHNDILGVDFLILDDVDKAYISKNGGYVDSVLDTLFRSRVQNCLPIIVTANKDIKEILQQQEEVFSKSLLSLFDESLLPIMFFGTDHRAELKKNARKRFLEDEQ